jgi:hypothetical protein
VGREFDPTANPAAFRDEASGHDVELEPFFCWLAYSVDREVHATADQEVGVTGSCGQARVSLYTNRKMS